MKKLTQKQDCDLIKLVAIVLILVLNLVLLDKRVSKLPIFRRLSMRLMVDGVKHNINEFFKRR
ncbi:MAG: hypothetical protein KAQ99_08805 [Candidatus Aureabacteria bacterium]|nr:hypothetical protein [Candidatus Auribacterota bacterium]